MKSNTFSVAGLAFAAILATSATAFATTGGATVHQSVAPAGTLLHQIGGDYDRGHGWRDRDHDRGGRWEDDRGRWGGGHHRRCRFWRHECADRWGWGGFRFRRCLIRHGCF